MGLKEKRATREFQETRFESLKEQIVSKAKYEVELEVMDEEGESVWVLVHGEAERKNGRWTMGSHTQTPTVPETQMDHKQCRERSWVGHETPPHSVVNGYVFINIVRALTVSPSLSNSVSPCYHRTLAKASRESEACWAVNWAVTEDARAPARIDRVHNAA